MTRTTLGGLVVVVALAVLGCGSDGTADEAAEEGAAVTASTERIAERAAEILDASVDEIEVATARSLEPAACRFHEAWVVDSLDPYPLQVAELPDGSLVTDRPDDGNGGDHGVADTILRSCFVDPGLEPTADAVAETVVRFGRTPGPLVVADPATSTGLTTEAGVAYHEPTLTTSPSGTTAVFFAFSPELDELMRVEATIDGDGTLDVTYDG